MGCHALSAEWPAAASRTPRGVPVVLGPWAVNTTPGRAIGPPTLNVHTRAHPCLTQTCILLPRPNSQINPTPGQKLEQSTLDDILRYGAQELFAEEEEAAKEKVGGAAGCEGLCACGGEGGMRCLKCQQGSGHPQEQ